MSARAGNAQDVLLGHGIRLSSYAAGRYYATCPECSPRRSAAHRNAQCLGVTIEADVVRFGCNHCGWTGPQKGNGKGNGAGRRVRSASAVARAEAGRLRQA
jgi:hypothetical protein